jgi:hypothetical protein
VIPADLVPPVEIIVVEIEPEDTSRAWMWTTLGLLILGVSAAVVWILVAKLFSWPVTIALFVTLTLIMVLMQLRHR